MRIHDSTSCMYVASCASSMFILTAVYPTSRISTCLSVNCNLQVADYRILFDDDRYPASGCSLIKSGERLMMTVQRASDAERGTWSEPDPSGPPLAHPDTNSRASPPRTCWTTEPWSPAASIWRKGFDRRQRRARPVSAQRHPHRAPRAGCGPVLLEPDRGRLVFSMRGSAARGDNWQCGVLLSDDGGRTLRYRQVGYEPDPAIRKDPGGDAGFNDRRGAHSDPAPSCR